MAFCRDRNATRRSILRGGPRRCTWFSMIILTTSAILSLFARATAGSSSQRQEELLFAQGYTIEQMEGSPSSRERPETGYEKHQSPEENRRLEEDPWWNVPRPPSLSTFPSVEESTVLFLHVFKVRKHDTNSRQNEGLLCCCCPWLQEIVNDSGYCRHGCDVFVTSTGTTQHVSEHRERESRPVVDCITSNINHYCLVGLM